jgi:hypothetical protein
MDKNELVLRIVEQLRRELPDYGSEEERRAAATNMADIVEADIHLAITRGTSTPDPVRLIEKYTSLAIAVHEDGNPGVWLELATAARLIESLDRMKNFESASERRGSSAGEAKAAKNTTRRSRRHDK